MDNWNIILILAYMKTVNQLIKGDYIAFPFQYNASDDKEIIVTNITCVYEDHVLVHFLYGYKSLGASVKKEDILAIGNLESGKAKIKGWTGSFDVVKPDNKLLIKNLK